jgi:hypothetical protein
VNVDEFAHNGVEQQARRDQLRVLAALGRRDRQRVPATPQAEEDTPTPTQAPAADVEPSMEMVDFCVAPSVTLDSGTASSPPTRPTQLHDGGGADVGGVGSHQTQDTPASRQIPQPRASRLMTPAPEQTPRLCIKQGTAGWHLMGGLLIMGQAAG